MKTGLRSAHTSFRQYQLTLILFPVSLLKLERAFYFLETAPSRQLIAAIALVQKLGRGSNLHFQLSCFVTHTLCSFVSVLMDILCFMTQNHDSHMHDTLINQRSYSYAAISRHMYGIRNFKESGLSRIRVNQIDYFDVSSQSV